MIIRKSTIAFIILSIALVYTISPWFFEKKLLFNEILSFIGLVLLAYHQFKIEKDPVIISVLLLIAWGLVQMIFSLLWMDSFYYLLRNSVIVYSMFGFFLGYFCFKYLPSFIEKIRTLLQVYITILLAIPVSKFYFERFGMAVLFPALFRKAGRWTLPLLILLNLLYGIQYQSATAVLIALLFCLLFIIKEFKFFLAFTAIALLVFMVFFFSIQPNLNIIRIGYSPYSDAAIHRVMDSHPILSLDGNSTWRLVLWKQVLVDQFPKNLLGIGFGTPMYKYFPVEEEAKIKSLPYVLGAHNSFIYLFGRLGLVYLILIGIIYYEVFREYFLFKDYYYKNSHIFLFWSFLSSTVIALVNPALESPIYAAGYWILLGFLARVIYIRRNSSKHQTLRENIVYP